MSVLKLNQADIITRGLDFVPINRIQRDGGTQARAKLDPEHLERLIEALEAGNDFPAITVFYDGNTYWLADGFHRVEAYSRSKGPNAEIVADVIQGDRRAAVLYSVGANSNHGLPRKREDTQRAIETLLRDPEWGKWSDREIARRVVCDHKTVAAARVRLGGEIPHLTERRAPDGKLYPVSQPARPTISPTPVPVSAPTPVPAPVRAPASEAPLSDAELSDLSLLGGWESEEAIREGQIAMRLCRGEHWNRVETRSPSGWRYELEQLRHAAANAEDLRQREAAVIQRANVLGYRVTSLIGGGYRLMRGDVPMGGAQTLYDLRVYVEELEHRYLEQQQQPFDEDEEEEADAPPAPVDPAVQDAHLSHVTAHIAAMLDRLSVTDRRVLYLLMLGDLYEEDRADDERVSEAVWKAALNMLNGTTDAALEWAIAAY